MSHSHAAHAYMLLCQGRSHSQVPQTQAADSLTLTTFHEEPTCANSNAMAPGPYGDDVARFLALLMTSTILLAFSPVGSPSVIVMTRMGLGRVFLWTGPTNRGLMILASMFVPKGVMPLNLILSTMLLAEALSLTLLPSTLAFIHLMVMPSSSKRVATSETLANMAFRSLILSPPVHCRAWLQHCSCCHQLQ